MENPYFIRGPALISFSGGRTSGRMLWEILDAHGGTLPADIHVVFTNTGKERKETLDFVHAVEVNWGVHIRWLEWRDRRKRTPITERFEEVSHNSASRNGEPFKALCRSKSAVPNVMARWCTEHLKLQVCVDFMALMGYVDWLNVVGLRADEMHRVFKKIAQNEAGKNPFRYIMPMASSGPNKQWGRTKVDVRTFWGAQPFDLQTEDGNCDNCFLKGKARLLDNAYREPSSLDDWIEMEGIGGATFTTEYSYSDLRYTAEHQGRVIPYEDDVEYDAECGTC